MKDYILDRMRADAVRLLALGANEGKLQHQGLKGRLRELLIDNVLRPWLPPYTSCGTGMIIAAEDAVRAATQDDIIVFDSSLTPPVLASADHATDGVFLYNSVIARIEVKSTLSRNDIRDFVRSSREIAALKHSVQPGFNGELEGTLNLLFAYASDAKGDCNPNYQINRIIEVMKEQSCDPSSGVISMVCIAGHGFWKIGGTKERRYWKRLTMPKPEDGVVWFMACLSNSAYLAHAHRQGRDPSKGLEGGIGMYLPSPYEKVA